jgi:hypothetical protein
MQFKSRTQRWLGRGADATLPFGWQVTTACSAGALASLATNPLDMAKLRLQVQRGAAAVAVAGGASDSGLGFHYRGMLHGLSEIVAKEGWRALFRGAGARVAFHAPSTAITMTLFERCKAFFQSVLREDR